MDATYNAILGQFPISLALLPPKVTESSSDDPKGHVSWDPKTPDLNETGGFLKITGTAPGTVEVLINFIPEGLPPFSQIQIQTWAKLKVNVVKVTFNPDPVYVPSIRTLPPSPQP